MYATQQIASEIGIIFMLLSWMTAIYLVNKGDHPRNMHNMYSMFTAGRSRSKDRFSYKRVRNGNFLSQMSSQIKIVFEKQKGSKKT